MVKSFRWCASHNLPLQSSVRGRGTLYLCSCASVCWSRWGCRCNSSSWPAEESRTASRNETCCTPSRASARGNSRVWHTEWSPRSPLSPSGRWTAIRGRMMDESIRTSEYSCIGQLSAILLHNMSSSNNMYIKIQIEVFILLPFIYLRL